MFHGITFWNKVLIGQNNGFYLEKSISASVLVRFGGDNLNLPKGIEFIFDGTSQDLSSFDQSDPPELQYSFFSGSYTISYENDKLETEGGRPVYFERNATLCKDDPACGIFYYMGIYHPFSPHSQERTRQVQVGIVGAIKADRSL